MYHRLKIQKECWEGTQIGQRRRFNTSELSLKAGLNIDSRIWSIRHKWKTSRYWYRFAWVHSRPKRGYSNERWSELPQWGNSFCDLVSSQFSQIHQEHQEQNYDAEIMNKCYFYTIIWNLDQNEPQIRFTLHFSIIRLSWSFLLFDFISGFESDLGYCSYLSSFLSCKKKTNCLR